jgi:hypothetical protein
MTGSIIIKEDNTKQVCNVCGDRAHIKDKNKWWCGLDFYTAHGFCKKGKQKGIDEESNND